MPDRLRLGVSMRVVGAADYVEPRDAVAHDWWHFLADVLPEALPVPVPNLGDDVMAWAAELGIGGVVLTGGEDVGTSPMRDATEQALLRWAQEADVPTLAVCRGLQLVHLWAGGELVPADEDRHVASRHRVNVLHDGVLGTAGSREVNSFHRWQIARTVGPCTVLATADGGGVEAFRWGLIVAIMWHPEREGVADPRDRDLVRTLFLGPAAPDTSRD